MLRQVIGFLVGLVVMYAGVTVAFVVVMTAMGPDRVFAPGTWQASMRFIGFTALLAFGAAIAGGAACQMIARDRRVAMVLALLVLVVGLVMAGVQAASGPVEEPPAREQGATLEDLGEAREKGWIREPLWLAFANPILGALGVMIGAMVVPKGAARRGLRKVPGAGAPTTETEKKTYEG